MRSELKPCNSQLLKNKSDDVIYNFKKLKIIIINYISSKRLSVLQVYHAWRIELWPYITIVTDDSMAHTLTL